MFVRGACSKMAQKGVEAVRVAWVVKRRARAGMCIMASWRGRVESRLTMSLQGGVSMEFGIEIERLASPRRMRGRETSLLNLA